MLKGFLFDLDGTLWDSEKAIVKTIFQAASQAGIHAGKGQIAKQFKKATSPIIVLKHYHIPADVFWKFYKQNYMDVALFFGNTEDIFNTLLERKKTIGFITSLKKEYALSLLEKFNLSSYAKILITPSECRTPKPSPVSIIMALEKLHIRSEYAIYTGDQDSDIVAAKRAGCKSGLAKWGIRNDAKECPDYSFLHLEEILALSEEKGAD